jgi:hypothetical protein
MSVPTSSTMLCRTPSAIVSKRGERSIRHNIRVDDESREVQVELAVLHGHERAHRNCIKKLDQQSQNRSADGATKRSEEKGSPVSTAIHREHIQVNRSALDHQNHEHNNKHSAHLIQSRPKQQETRRHVRDNRQRTEARELERERERERERARRASEGGETSNTKTTPHLEHSFGASDEPRSGVFVNASQNRQVGPTVHIVQRMAARRSLCVARCAAWAAGFHDPLWRHPSTPQTRKVSPLGANRW